MSLASGPGRAGTQPLSPHELGLVVPKHVDYIQKLDTRKDELEYWLTEHLRLNGVYWGLTALHLLGSPDALPRDKTIEFVLSCQNRDGGFGAAPGHDSHMLYTVSAVQILATVDAISALDLSGGKQRVGKWLASLQDAQSGTFAGDEWGETDTRFLFGAFIALSILDLMDLIDMDKAVGHVQACANFDGAYGRSPGAESHSGQVYTCVGALSIARRTDLIDVDRLGAWLAERQLPNGGLNGRPEKLEDVCYSWWVMSSLAMIDRLHWLDGDKLKAFILSCQDPDQGGIADRPGDMVDVFHTVFGIAGLSLLHYPHLAEVDPIYICPNQPDFSDTSHLLTHVSSKGHLAHLHKLQVKSHQEIAAGVQLANYNQWYQRHGLARLLSERMQQKESRRAKTSAVITRKRARSVKNEASTELGHFAASPIRKVGRGGNRAPTPQLRANKRETLGQGDEDDNGNASDQDYLPGNQDDRSKHQLFYTPIKNYPAPPSSPHPLDYSPGVDSVLDSALTLKIAKLKGKVWPGMALFDAATPDEQRRRNQKKDGSVLRRMERLSRLVDPQEAVYSPNLSLQKQRHIDDLDELGSLVDGEEPAPKPKARLRKKKPLAPVSENVPRLGKRKAKGVSTQSQRHSEVPSGLAGIARLASSSAQASYGFHGDYSPTTDENTEFRLTIGNMSLHKRRGNYAIFNDQDSPTRGLNRYSAFAPLQSLNNSYGLSPMQHRLPFNSAPWLQPQHQNPIYFGNHFAAQRHVQPAYQPLPELGLGREIAGPSAERASSNAYQMTNPLIWKSPQAALNGPSSDGSFGSFSGCFASTSTLSDPFGYSRNPLLEALAHLNPHPDASHATSSASSGQATEIGGEAADRDSKTPSDQHEANLSPDPEECPRSVVDDA
ncbi:hypothetical protein DV735_g1160, partial [Chaetothyriales sp. CBS 134920]